MKAKYNISTLKRRGHPLSEKIRKNEITLLNPFDISDEDFNQKLAELNPEERGFITAVRNNRILKA
ncbi:MAG: hypothetical protein FWG87_14380 [Defluviitaleaceae bacterium]|nr:hypothetical protein [Defluviitaleaceae bacterium]